MTKDEILFELDTLAQELVFPDFNHGYQFYISSRINCFVLSDKWGIIIEHFGVFNRCLEHDSIVNFLFCYGPIFNETYFEVALRVTSDFSQDEPLFDLALCYKLNSNANKFLARNTTIYFDNQSRIPGIKSDIPTNNKYIYAQDMLRSIINDNKNIFMASLLELQSIIGKNIVPILVIDDFYHPVIPEELPSQTSTYTTIVDVVLNNDASLYIPDKVFNTHWSNWDYSGSM